MKGWHLSRIVREALLETPTHLVWEVLAAFDRVQRWDPGVSESQWVTRRRGPGAVRRIVVHGRTFEQEVTRWTHMQSLELRTHAHGPFRWVVQTWQLRQRPDGTGVRLQVEADYRLPVKWLIDPMLTKWVEGSLPGLRAYLDRDELPSIVVESPQLFPMTS